MLENFRKYKKLEFVVSFYVLFFIIIYFLNTNGWIEIKIIYNLVEYFGVISFLFLGVLYSTTFFSPMVAAILIFYSGHIPVWQIIVFTALGVAIADLIDYKILKSKMHTEVKELEHSNLIRFFSKFRICQNKTCMTFLGFILLASPVPDSVGVMLIEEEDFIKTKCFFVLDFILNMGVIYFFLHV